MRKKQVAHMCIIVMVILLTLACELPGTEFMAGNETGGTLERAATPVVGANRQVYGPFLDASGQIETRIYLAYNSGVQNSIYVEVDPEDVLVGGAAWVSFGQLGFLTGSFPYIDKKWSSGGKTYSYATKWAAESRSHTWDSSHTLYVQAIGMRLKKNSPLNTYMSRSDMLYYIRYTWAVSGYASHPSVTAFRPQGFSMIGGGARVLANPGAGNILTHSCGVKVPDGRQICDGWFAASKDHVQVNSARIVSYAISIIMNNGMDWPGMTPSIPGFGNFNIRWHRSGVNYPAEYPTSATNLWNLGLVMMGPPEDGRISFNDWYAMHKIEPYDNMSHMPYLEARDGLPITWNLVGIGAKVVSQTEYGWGRLLTGMWFNTDGFSTVLAADRDHVYPDYGTLDVEYFSLVKDSGYDLFGRSSTEVVGEGVDEDE